MFTPNELNILQSALRSWKGFYPCAAKLTDSELQKNKNGLETADNLAIRFEEILQHYFEIENSHLPQ